MDKEVAPDRGDIILQLLLRACDDASRHYEDSYKSFAGVDGKAQSVATIAGICIAAVVGFLRVENINALISKCSCWAEPLIVLPGLFALVSVILSVITLRVRKIKAPYGAPGQIQEIEMLRALPEGQLNLEHAYRFYQTRLADWDKVVADIDSAVDTKANYLLWAQILLASSLVFLIILIWQLATSLVGLQ